MCRPFGTLIHLQRLPSTHVLGYDCVALRASMAQSKVSALHPASPLRVTSGYMVGGVAHLFGLTGLLRHGCPILLARFWREGGSRQSSARKASEEAFGVHWRPSLECKTLRFLHRHIRTHGFV